MIYKILFSLMLLPSLALTGCAGKSLLGQDPRCPFSERGGCQSIKSINKMIDERRYTPDGAYIQEPCVKCTVIRKKSMKVYVPAGVDKFGKPYRGHVRTEQMTEALD